MTDHPPRGRRRRAWIPPGTLAGALVLVVAAPLVGQEPLTWGGMQAALRERPVTAGERIAYGPGPERYGELTLPPGPGPHPVALVLHGGCWLSIADLTYVRALAQALNRLGWATWTLEFNRIDQDEGRWPGILADVALGAGHLRELARTHPLDLGRIVAVGHSSGGHLALWLAGRRDDGRGVRGVEGIDGAGPRIRGVIGLAPITALEDFQARSDRCGPSIVTTLLGGEDVPPDVRERRRAATDPGAHLPLGVPQLVVMGELDGIVPADHGRAWARLVRAAGDPVELRVVPGAGHFEVVAPWTAPWRTVERTVDRFLRALDGG